MGAATATATATEAAEMMEGGWEDPPVNRSSLPFLLRFSDPQYDGMDIKMEGGMKKIEHKSGEITTFRQNRNDGDREEW